MGTNNSNGKLNPELAEHLAESMKAQMTVAPPAEAGGMGQPKAAVSNGDAKRHRHEHGHDQFVAHSRPGNEAAVTAVHRTSRPQMKHSS
ncbi:hypothetical protein V1639_16205 [Pseudarthrobacter sp. J75]|uniref:hypothetical protein n=1 Tax=unclassified Pseudarthrobacter TaxID=2647000 RepID=UPI002E807D48|nr:MULTISPECIES: hypothetical protein [unclassified Pseudarthrobacter]MEE2523579.1 hypothetical protein [Pseudarthrobacter sp. J47]MEE2530561.1 hypothetical protein [Pseudarthrobacter sp. J75]MEE2570016.1 hypothetical protein [Pseudarthrobacter sp. J64]